MYSAAKKVGMPGFIEAIRYRLPTNIFSENWAAETPMSLYCIALEQDWREEAKQAAERLI